MNADALRHQNGVRLGYTLTYTCSSASGVAQNFEKEEKQCVVFSECIFLYVERASDSEVV